MFRSLELSRSKDPTRTIVLFLALVCEGATEVSLSLGSLHRVSGAQLGISPRTGINGSPRSGINSSPRTSLEWQSSTRGPGAGQALETSVVEAIKPAEVDHRATFSRMTMFFARGHSARRATEPSALESQEQIKPTTVDIDATFSNMTLTLRKGMRVHDSPPEPSELESKEQIQPNMLDPSATFSNMTTASRKGKMGLFFLRSRGAQRAPESSVLESQEPMKPDPEDNEPTFSDMTSRKGIMESWFTRVRGAQRAPEPRALESQEQMKPTMEVAHEASFIEMTTASHKATRVRGGRRALELRALESKEQMKSTLADLDATCSNMTKASRKGECVRAPEPSVLKSQEPKKPTRADHNATVSNLTSALQKTVKKSLMTRIRGTRRALEPSALESQEQMKPILVDPEATVNNMTTTSENGRRVRGSQRTPKASTFESTELLKPVTMDNQATFNNMTTTSQKGLRGVSSVRVALEASEPNELESLWPMKPATANHDANLSNMTMASQTGKIKSWFTRVHGTRRAAKPSALVSQGPMKPTTAEHEASFINMTTPLRRGSSRKSWKSQSGRSREVLGKVRRAPESLELEKGQGSRKSLGWFSKAWGRKVMPLIRQTTGPNFGKHSTKLPAENSLGSRGTLLRCLGWCAKGVYTKKSKKPCRDAIMGDPVGNWTPTRVQTEESYGHIQAATYVNPKYNSVAIIAFRGTEFKTYRSLRQSISVFLRGNLVKSAIDGARAYYRRVREEDEFSQIYVTGHSLGGFIAEAVASWENVSGAVFNAPGPVRGNYCGNYRPQFEVHLALRDPVLFPLPQHSSHISTPEWHVDGNHGKCGEYMPSGKEFKGENMPSGKEFKRVSIPAYQGDVVKVNRTRSIKRAYATARRWVVKAVRWAAIEVVKAAVARATATGADVGAAMRAGAAAISRVSSARSLAARAAAGKAEVGAIVRAASGKKLTGAGAAAAASPDEGDRSASRAVVWATAGAAGRLAAVGGTEALRAATAASIAEARAAAARIAANRAAALRSVAARVFRKKNTKTMMYGQPETAIQNPVV